MFVSFVFAVNVAEYAPDTVLGTSIENEPVPAPDAGIVIELIVGAEIVAEVVVGTVLDMLATTGNVSVFCKEMVNDTVSPGFAPVCPVG